MPNPPPTSGVRMRSAFAAAAHTVSVPIRVNRVSVAPLETRGAVASWAKTLSRELGPDGITVNNVLPGYTETARLAQILADRAAATGKAQAQVADGMLATVPVGRFAKAGEVGGVIAFLCSPAAAYVNGVNLPVDGGRMQSI